MNLKINYHIARIIRTNLVYILVFIILIISLIVTFLFFLNQYGGNINEISSLNTEIENLEKKKRLINYKNDVIKGELDLDKVNSILTALIPSKEDYFSIIISLEKISQKTNFIITSYNLKIGTTDVGKLSLSVEGQGDLNTFIEFLKNYNFGSGRLITIDRIDFNSGPFIGSTVNLNFYSGKGTSGQELSTFTPEEKKLLSDVMSKVQIDLKTEDASQVNYPTKQNPF